MHVESNGIPKNLLQSIERIAKKEGYISHNVDTNLIPMDGASFLGEHYLITLKGKTEKGEKEDNIFIKNRVPGAKLEETVNLPQAYASEAFIYNEMFKIFNELQDKAKIPEEDRFRVIKSYDESNSEALMLENMVLKGYKSCHRTYVASKNVAELSIKQLAKFHALSFVVQEKYPEYLEKIKSIKYPFTFNDDWDQGCLNIARLAANHVKGEAREKLDKFIDTQFLDKWKRYLQDTTTTRCCLCHGDFRLNNTLMKHSNGEVVDIIIVDYQTLHYACPIEDLLFFIFTGTEKKFREQYLEYLKDFYYETFSDFLKKFDLDSEDIYPRKEFEKDYKDRLDYGLISSLFFNTFILAAEGDIPEPDNQATASMAFKLLDCFPERMQGIVDDFESWGYL